MERGEGWASYYETLSDVPEWLKKPANFIVDALPTLKRGGAMLILDLGCGLGRHSMLLAREGFTPIGLDVSVKALEIAKKWASFEGLSSVMLICASMTHLPLRRACLDAAISVSVIHHALSAEIKETISELHRTLKPCGLFIANLLSESDMPIGAREIEERTFLLVERFGGALPAEDSFEEVHHYFTREELEELLSGFSEVDISPLASEETGGPRYWLVRALKN